MNKQELHDKYQAMFGKEVSLRYSNDFEWILKKLEEGPPPAVDPPDTVAEKEPEVQLGGLGYRSSDAIEKLRRDDVKRKMISRGLRIVTNGRSWEVLHHYELDSAFGDGKRKKYKSQRNAENEYS